MYEIYIVTRTDDDMTDTLIGAFSTDEEAMLALVAERRAARAEFLLDGRAGSRGTAFGSADAARTVWTIRRVAIDVNVRVNSDRMTEIYRVRGF
jgi:hypothetical protein